MPLMLDTLDTNSRKAQIKEFDMRRKIATLFLLAGILFSGASMAAPLAEGASKFLGNITTYGAVRSDFGTYWNQITAENECKWGSIERTRGQYNFSGCDAAYNWAKNNGGRFKFHALVWGSQYPSWLEQLSVEDTRTAITQWFDRVAQQYPDMEMIDVVNEAIRTSSGYHSGYTNTKIIEALGGDNGNYTFVTTAFQMARERWPDAILIYNDYNTFRWQINEGIDLINKIKAAGAPVDAYGQQAHDLTDMEYDEFKAALEKIHNETQLPLYITEYDIGTDDDALQLQRYQEQIPEFWNAEYVAGVTLWGYIYGATWTTNGNSGIIREGNDRPAMTWLKEYMANNAGVNTTGLNGSAPDTVPQVPYSNSIAIPGTLEAENYDVGGQTQSYYDSDVANQGGEYRQDRVDVVGTGDGYAVGYTATGEWLEYTVHVAEDGIYNYEVIAASGADGSSFKLLIEDQEIADMIEVANGGDWDSYSSITGSTRTLSAGSHILKIAITGDYVNIDKVIFTAPTTGMGHLESNLSQGTRVFEVYTIQGNYMESLEAQNFSELKLQMQSSKRERGVYLIRDGSRKSEMIRIME
jgi:GH35 family endo-1,4-beta-xylanase